MDVARRPDLPRRQPAHQAGRSSGSGCSARSARPTRTCIFLAEAFTKPAMMRGLGTVGLPPVLHLLHLAQPRSGSSRSTSRGLPRDAPRAAAELLREHPRHPARLTCSTAARRRSRSAPSLAATGSPTWGVYAGFELFEHVAVRPGSEEYLDTEKFQIRIRDWDAADAEGRTLAPYLTRLNEIRRRHPALQQLRNLTVHSSEDDSIDRLSASSEGDDTVIVVVNVDPHGTRETTVHLDMPALGLDWHDQFVGARRDHRRDLDVGRAQLRPPRPVRRARPRPHRPEAPRDPADAHQRRHRRGPARERARLVQDRRVLRGPGPLVQGLQRRRRRRLQRADREARLPRVARRRLPVGAAVLHLAAARRRLRRGRLHQHPARGRHRRGLPRRSSTRRTSAASG